jgi:hypothetical protein
MSGMIDQMADQPVIAVSARVVHGPRAYAYRAHSRRACACAQTPPRPQRVAGTSRLPAQARIWRVKRQRGTVESNWNPLVLTRPGGFSVDHCRQPLSMQCLYSWVLMSRHPQDLEARLITRDGSGGATRPVLPYPCNSRRLASLSVCAGRRPCVG